MRKGSLSLVLEGHEPSTLGPELRHVSLATCCKKSTVREAVIYSPQLKPRHGHMFMSSGLRVLLLVSRDRTISCDLRSAI